MTAKEARQALRKLNELDLRQKIDRARTILESAFATPKPIISFSGGRDSMVIACLARDIDPNVSLVYQDTGLADPRLLEWIRRFGGDRLTYRPPEADPEKTWKEKNCLPIGPKTAAENYRRANPELRIDASKCCNEHKAKPMNRYLETVGCTALVIGARGDDSIRHQFKLMWGEVIRSPRGWLLVYPILVWTQEDVLTYVRKRIPDYPLLYARNEEMGCRACAINLIRWPNQMQKLRAADPEYHRHLIVNFYGLDILMIKYRLTRAGARQLVDRDGWDSLIAQGIFDKIPKAEKGLR